MTTAAGQAVTILFRFYSDLMEQDAVEMLAATQQDETLGRYRIDTIPLYVAGLAEGDIVAAEYDAAEEMLAFREIVEHAGNSTIWVAVLDGEAGIADIRSLFQDLDCDSRAMDERYFALNMKAGANYLRVKDVLNQLRAQQLIDYAEAWLSAAHQY